ncbi:MAG: BRCT domain-containing protein [Burkholderiaceae bacterium]
MFVFTGEFLWGTRRECVKAVEKRGGIAKDSVTKETNFLCVGAMASPDWITANFGRKIQKAADMVHAKKHDIAIIREETWSAFL